MRLRGLCKEAKGKEQRQFCFAMLHVYGNKQNDLAKLLPLAFPLSGTSLAPCTLLHNPLKACLDFRQSAFPTLRCREQILFYSDISRHFKTKAPILSAV